MVLALYIDAIEWVEMPNTRGMSQYADGGFLASKPYVSSGKYVQRMSDYCQGCAYDVDQRHSDNACHSTACTGPFFIDIGINWAVIKECE